MPSDDDGLAPTEGPDWENGFNDALLNFQDAVTLWRRKEEATCEEKIAGRNLNQRTVASCDFTAEDCLKAHFPDREDDDDAPLQALVKVAKSQREELQQVLDLVRNHAERFEGHSSLTAQLPEQGSASARKSGADVVALLAELLDVASRNLNKKAGKEDERRGEERNGRGREEYRLRERREVRKVFQSPASDEMKDDYRRDDRSRREEEERYEDDRRRARDGAGRDDGRGRERGKDDYDDHRRDERRHDDRYKDDRRGREGRDDGRHYRAKDDYRRDDRRDDRYDDRRPPGPRREENGPRREENGPRREERPRSRSRGDVAA